MSKNLALLAFLAILFTLIGIWIINNFLMTNLAWPVKGRISSKYGNRTHPVTGAKSFHNGIDIAAPTGTDVLAPADGVVSKISWHNGGGNQLHIKHDNGYTTGYAHLSSYAVKVGDKVKKGQKVAEVGNTGASTGPHLHLTVRDKSGNLVDPLTVLS